METGAAASAPEPRAGRRPGAFVRILLEIAAGLLAVAVLAGAGKVILAALDREAADPLRLLEPQLVDRRPAPDFELRDREGKALRLSELRGRPVVLNFWSIDCPPCIEEMPALERLAAVARERGTFSVVTVSVEATFDEVRRAFPRGTELVVLFDPERAVVRDRYGTELFPETFVVDSEGQIRLRFDGPRNWAAPEVLELLARY